MEAGCSEMEGFLAVVINMGLIQLPEIESYCSINWITTVPFFSRLFSFEQFEQIFWLLHVSPRDPDSPERRIGKVKMLLDLLVGNFKKSFAPGEKPFSRRDHGFRGRYGPKEYMPDKPTKYGIKAFTLAESEHGYVLDILVYTGSDTLASANSDYSTLPQPARVVLHLLAW